MIFSMRFAVVEKSDMVNSFLIIFISTKMLVYVLKDSKVPNPFLWYILSV